MSRLLSHYVFLIIPSVGASQRLCFVIVAFPDFWVYSLIFFNQFLALPILPAYHWRNEKKKSLLEVSQMLFLKKKQKKKQHIIDF